MTVSITTLGMTSKNTTLSIIIHEIMTFSVTTLCRMTLGIMTFIMTILRIILKVRH
jgi:hypothetical protein